jgi:hypothetical protein
MLYVDASVLQLQGMKTPQELLAEAIKQHPVINATELGRKLGYKHPYQAINNLINGKRHFTRQLQERVSEVLGLPKTHFEKPDETVLRNEYIRARFEEFCTTEIGRRQSPDDLKLIHRIGNAFIGDRLPTKAFFETIALTIEGSYTTAQLSAALAENEALDRAQERLTDRAKPDKATGENPDKDPKR